MSDNWSSLDWKSILCFSVIIHGIQWCNRNQGNQQVIVLSKNQELPLKPSCGVKKCTTDRTAPHSAKSGPPKLHATYPLVNVYITNWKITMLSMDNSLMGSSVGLVMPKAHMSKDMQRTFGRFLISSTQGSFQEVVLAGCSNMNRWPLATWIRMARIQCSTQSTDCCHWRSHTAWLIRCLFHIVCRELNIVHGGLRYKNATVSSCRIWQLKSFSSGRSKFHPVKMSRDRKPKVTISMTIFNSKLLT